MGFTTNTFRYHIFSPMRPRVTSQRWFLPTSIFITPCNSAENLEWNKVGGVEIGKWEVRTWLWPNSNTCFEEVGSFNYVISLRCWWELKCSSPKQTVKMCRLQTAVSTIVQWIEFQVACLLKEVCMKWIWSGLYSWINCYLEWLEFLETLGQSQNQEYICIIHEDQIFNSDDGNLGKWSLHGTFTGSRHKMLTMWVTGRKTTKIFVS